MYIFIHIIALYLGPGYMNIVHVIILMQVTNTNFVLAYTYYAITCTYFSDETVLGRKTSLHIFREVRKREDNVQHTSILVLMRDEKNGRKKQARSNKQQQGKATQHTQGNHFS